MSIKEQLIEIIRREGFDFMSACELAHNVIQEFKADARKSVIYTIGKTSFTLNK